VNEFAALRPSPPVGEARDELVIQRDASSAATARSWLARSLDHRPMPPAQAEAAFAKAARAARSRFEHELVRSAHGRITRKEAPAIAEREGVRGVVVVTIVVAARVELADVLDVRDRPRLERALDALSALDPRDFVALEVIWSPADEREQVTAEEIEARYPELVRLEPAP